MKKFNQEEIENPAHEDIAAMKFVKKKAAADNEEEKKTKEVAPAPKIEPKQFNLSSPPESLDNIRILAKVAGLSANKLINKVLDDYISANDKAIQAWKQANKELNK